MLAGELAAGYQLGLRQWTPGVYLFNFTKNLHLFPVCFNFHALPKWAFFRPQHKDAYQVILDGVKGGPKEKRLAAQFIPKFFSSFPELADAAINAQLDLCEDEDVSVSGFQSLKTVSVLNAHGPDNNSQMYDLLFADKATGDQRAPTLCDGGEHPQGRRHPHPAPPDRYWLMLWC